MRCINNQSCLKKNILIRNVQNLICVFEVTNTYVTVAFQFSFKEFGNKLSIHSIYNFFSIAFWFISFYSRWLHVTLQTHTNFKVQGLALLFFLVFNWGRVCLFAYCLFGWVFFGGLGFGVWLFSSNHHLCCRSRFSFYFKFSAWGSNA